MGRGAGNIIFRSLGGPVERYTPWPVRAMQKGSILFLDYFFYFGGCSETAMGGGGARSVPFGVLMSPKRRVRAAHGRAREAKTE